MGSALFQLKYEETETELVFAITKKLISVVLVRMRTIPTEPRFSMARKRDFISKGH
jgi:hypothetical protein